jgi:predicted RND superfamily exporter protein
MLSQDDRIAAVPVFLDPGARKIESMEEVVVAVRSTLDNRPPPQGYTAQITGLPVLRVEVVDDLRSDLVRLMPFAGVVYLVVLWLMFRRLWGALLPLAGVGIGVAWTVGTLAGRRYHGDRFRQPVHGAIGFVA